LNFMTRYFISPDGYWVKFEVRQVPVTAARPRGLSYSLTLHDPQNRRIMGFDNAHGVPRAKPGASHDHRHFRKRVKPYEYADAAALLEDFWAAVDAMKEQIGWQ